MALTKLNQLYRQVILDHSSHPHHHGGLEHATDRSDLTNPTCGDVLQLQLVIEDQIIKDIRFDGSGCTISQASASMMTDVVIGKTVAESLLLADQFSLLVQGKEVTKLEELGDAALLSGVAQFPARIKCATLSWKALEKALVK
ncbi:Fe-S cluster assembly sulfur transfer protein SufU [Carnobacterium sp. ISL-102]|uniref:Fe-S cluster assembly sulfur transfer protein SufU n=1 Tax=Carnobacterium sp. ISL-102 TaxID=2819142 RepID=UPI001BEB2BA9|nr:SUF system NifU family Fe-S cluster assembly protein [Carnobacterium sp. ISL-102]MBT2732207.1 SUF system NifU family Fe-S cluster assembly protein [Carnobacterium sp. ISL-102]